jgi:flagellar basal-body rod modification protein FlgD
MANEVTATKSTWPNYSSNNTSSAGSNSGSIMGKDQFLKILITQLRNQDPAAPMQDREFIAQMAQFSSLEQMMNMGNEIKMLRQSLGLASSVIGQQVTWMTYDKTGAPIGEKSGIVEAIIMRDGSQLAKVNGVEINLDKITKIEAVPEDTTT